MPDARGGSRYSLDICLAGVNVRVDAPEAVLAVLDATLSHVPRWDEDSTPEVCISARRTADVWEIRGLDGSLKVLSGQSALPQVGGAVVTSTMHATATTRKVKAIRATVLEKDGRALAMLGDDWESAVTLAAHLHGRGWRYIGSDSALLDCATLEVFPVQKSLYVNSSAVQQFPVRYRVALETSPWYVTGLGIAFYAVDPRKAGHAQTWAPPAALSGVVVVDGAMAARPWLESFDAGNSFSERFSRLGIDWDRVSAVDLRLGGCVKTCDLVEHWFDAIAS